MAVRASICAVVLALLCGLASECSAKRNIAFYAFKGGADGAYAYGGLVQDASGDFYGTTGNGGSGGSCAGGCGTLFTLTAGGTHAVIHNFTGGMDGNWPNADLVSDAAGNIFGSTVIGNSSTGSIFKLATDGAFSVLHTFGQIDGSHPGVRLAAADNGDIYGTTGGGGAHGLGTIFKLASGGTLTTLYDFRDEEDGRWPYGGIVRDANGNLYGGTQNGGDPKCNCGTLFELDHTGTFSVLHTFKGKHDGSQPLGPLTIANDGIAGATLYGGAKCQCGVIFHIGADNSFSVLYAFPSRKKGSRPSGALIADDGGNLYGTTQAGGGCKAIDLGCGTVFRLAPDGVLTTLHAFKAGSDGYGPVSALVLSGANLYGTVPRGGDLDCNGTGCGMVFRVKNTD